MSFLNESFHPQFVTSFNCFEGNGSREEITTSLEGINYGQRFQLPHLLHLLAIISICILIGWETISKFCWRHFTASVEVQGCTFNDHSTRLYKWVLTQFSKTLQFPHSIAKADSTQDARGKVTESVKSYPSFGTVDFKYKGRWIRMERVGLPEITVADVEGEEATCEKITFTSYPWNKGLIYEFLNDCKPPPRDPESENKVVVYACKKSCDGSWYWTELGHPKRVRPLSTVILPEDVKDKIVEDVKSFKKSEDWYLSRGIPFRRGYLMYGPPGCGKSSFVRSLAGEMKFDICVISLTTFGLDDDKLNWLMNSTPEVNCIILLEDIDAAFGSRVSPDKSNRQQQLSFEGNASSSVTFGGLLNALDGVAATEGRIVFMTTNYIDRLDPAMIRPGRVDLKVLVDYPNDLMLDKMFSRFYEGSGEEVRKRFVKRLRLVGGKKVSMASVQGLFMFHKGDGEGAVEGIDKYFKEQIKISDKTESIGMYC